MTLRLFDGPSQNFAILIRAPRPSVRLVNRTTLGFRLYRLSASRLSSWDPANCDTLFKTFCSTFAKSHNRNAHLASTHNDNHRRSWQLAFPIYFMDSLDKLNTLSGTFNFGTFAAYWLSSRRVLCFGRNSL